MTKRRILVLGASGDIGGAVVDKFKAMGEEVTSTGRKELDLESAASISKFFGGSSDVAASKASKASKTADVDVLIHCAGYNQPKLFTELTEEDLIKTLRVAALGFLAVVQNVAPGMKKRGGGHILALSSLYGTISRPKRLAYAASKHALNGVIKTLALELGPFNVKVNSLSPGFVDTKMTRKNNDAATIRSFEQKIPLGRLARPSDIAEIAWSLCAPENTYLTGQDIIVDGGYMAGGFQS